MKNIMKKIQPYVLALGIGAAALTGCGPIRPNYPTMDKVKKVLGTRADGPLHKINDYVVPGGRTYYLVLTTAGIYAGDVKVNITPDGRYIITGSYSRNPEALERVLENMDKNNDRIITPEEALEGYREALEERIRQLEE